MGLARQGNLLLGALARTGFAMGPGDISPPPRPSVRRRGDYSVGGCFDLTNEGFVEILGDSFKELANAFEAEGLELPKITKAAGKRRELDCLAINHCLERLEGADRRYDSVRGAFLEGPPVFDGTTISKETHIQVAVRNPACILGVFRPNSSE